MRYIYLFYLTFFIACAISTSQKITYEVTFPKDNKDEIKIVPNYSPTSALIDIHSDFGIGEGNVKLAGGKWPDTLIIRLRIQSLESFTLTIGKDEFNEGTKIEKDKLSVKAFDKNGMVLEGEYPWHKVGYYEVYLPKSIFPEGCSSINIHWIDTFRG